MQQNLKGRKLQNNRKSKPESNPPKSSALKRQRLNMLQSATKNFYMCCSVLLVNQTITDANSHSGRDRPEPVPCRREERVPAVPGARQRSEGPCPQRSDSKRRELPRAARGQVLCCSSESLSFVIWVKPTSLLSCSSKNH